MGSEETRRDIVVHTSSGPEEVITNDVAVIYDLLCNSMDFGSDFLSHDDLESLIRLGTVMGWKVPEDAVRKMRDTKPSERFLLCILVPDGWAYVENVFTWKFTDDPESAFQTYSAEALRDVIASWLRRERPRYSGPTQERLRRLRCIRVEDQEYHLLRVGMQLSLGPPLEIPNMPVWPAATPPDDSP